MAALQGRERTAALCWRYGRKRLEQGGLRDQSHDQFLGACAFVDHRHTLTIGQMAPSHAAPRDQFFWMTEINKASAVMIVERGIVPKPLGARIHDAIVAVDAAGDKPGA